MFMKKHDIAKSEIFTGEEEFKPNQLENLMEIALIKNKPKFVKLLLEHGLNMRKFLTYRRMIFLYNSVKVS
jgi:transient receptor potential cation channel subfamily M protein 8